MALENGSEHRRVEPRLDEDRRRLARLWCHVARSIRAWPKRLFGLMLRTIGRRRLIFGERLPVETVCKAVQHFFTISARSSRPRCTVDKEDQDKQLHRQPKAYQDRRFLESKDARALRILAEYLEPLSRFRRHGVQDTIVFMGSARILSREVAEAALSAAELAGSGVAAARAAPHLSTPF